MLDNGRIPQIATKEEKKADEYEALQSFLRSISSTATLPPYVKGETYSSVRGVFNQVSLYYFLRAQWCFQLPIL